MNRRGVLWLVAGGAASLLGSCVAAPGAGPPTNAPASGAPTQPPAGAPTADNPRPRPQPIPNSFVILELGPQ